MKIFEGPHHSIDYDKENDSFIGYVGGKKFDLHMLQDLDAEHVPAYYRVKASLGNTNALYKKVNYLKCSDFCLTWFSRPRDVHILVDHLEKGIYWNLNKRTDGNLVHLKQLSLGVDGQLLIGERTLIDGDAKNHNSIEWSEVGIHINTLKKHIKYDGN